MRMRGSRRGDRVFGCSVLFFFPFLSFFRHDEVMYVRHKSFFRLGEYPNNYPGIIFSDNKFSTDN